METEELKKQLINKINQSEDKSLLQGLYNLMILETSLDVIYSLTEEESELLSIAREQVRAGEYLSQEEVDKKVQKWLEE